MARQSRSVFKAKQPRLGTFIGIAWCLAAVAITYFLPAPFDTANWKLFDRKMLRHTATTSTDPDKKIEIVHVDVDDEAVKQHGQWPWDRELSGKLVQKLYKMGAKLVVFDIFYASPGKSPGGNEKFFAAIKEAGNVISATGMPITDDPDKDLENNDPARADALHDRAWPLKIPRSVKLFRVSRIDDKLIPLVQIINGSRDIGHIKSTPDRDGVHRRIPLLLRFEDKFVPSLSMAAMAAWWNVSPEQIRVRPGEIEVSRGQETLTIPVDEKGRMVIRWGRPWKAFRSFSAHGVLDDDRDPEGSFYKGKIVVVGVTATGTFDRGSTPVEVDYPLSRIHSHAMYTMLKETFVWQVSFFPYLVLPIVMLTVLFSWLGAKLTLRRAVVICLAVIMVLLVTPQILFSVFSCEIPTAEPLFIFVPAAAAVLIRKGTTMELEAARASRALERYLSPELLESIVNRDTGIDLTTKRKELTMLVADIEGFSTISEIVEVEYINQFLDDFFERMTNAVFDQGGTVDKFLGDGLLAFFGEPVPLENHALAAVEAALQMQREMVPLNLKWVASGIAAFEKGVRIRIGINTGLVVVGNIGSTQRMEYTVLGSAVNIASRLQALASPGGIMMTARTKSKAKEPIECEGHEIVRVKGIDKDIEVYRITKIPPREDQPSPTPVAARG